MSSLDKPNTNDPAASSSPAHDPALERATPDNTLAPPSSPSSAGNAPSGDGGLYLQNAHHGAPDSDTPKGDAAGASNDAAAGAPATPPQADGPSSDNSQHSSPDANGAKVPHEDAATGANDAASQSGATDQRIVTGDTFTLKGGEHTPPAPHVQSFVANTGGNELTLQGNEAPTAIALSNTTIDENASGAVVGTLTTIDPDAGDQFTYQVSDDRFEVVDGELKLKDGISLDHEGEPSVLVSVTSTDSAGHSIIQNFTITVANVNESPTDIALSNATVAENAAGAVIGTLSASDPDAGDTHTYTVSDNRFEVVDGQLKLKDGISLDHEAEPNVTVHVTATDAGGLSFSEDFTITVANVNEAPTGVDLSNATINENAAGAVVGALSAVDPDAGDAHTYVVSDDRFEVVDGHLKLKDGISLDHETQPSVTVQVTATDAGGLSVSENFTVTIANVNEAPTDIDLSNATINENAAGAVVGTLSATDPDAGDTHTYVVSDNRFEVVDGQLKLKDGISLDHEAEPSVTVQVTATDAGGLSVSENFTITVANVNEAPTDIDLSNTVISENAAGAVVGALSAVDPDAGDSHTYLVSDDRFEVVDGHLKLKDGISLDHEAEPNVTVQVTATDAGGLSVSENFTITVANVNEAPTDIALSNATVAENAAGAVVGTLSTTDPDAGDTQTYAVSDARFEVVAGELKLKAGIALDHEAEASVTVQVTATDAGGLSVSENFTITVANVNEAPTGIALSSATVTENAAGAVIGTLTTTDPDAGDTHSYTVSDGRFEVIGGQLKLKAGISLDYEAAHTVSLNVTATDAGGQSVTQSFTIAVTDVAEINVINGTPGNDTLNGTAGIDQINGLAGNDTINAGGGDDFINGGAGNDTLNGGAGSDTFQIGAGDGFDRFNDNGATGTDKVVATADNVAIGLQSGFGAASGIEEISADGHAGVTIQGGTGNDTLDFSTTTLTGITKIDGGAGNDTITGTAVADVIAGGAGDDTLKGGQGGDTYQVGAGAGFDKYTDTGTTGTDTVVATGDNVAIGLQTGYGAASGIEVISSGGFANVSIQGGTGNDTLDFSGTTLSGIAKIDGGAGNDTITGSAGADTIAGGAGNDTLKGGDGGDTYQVGVGAGVDNILDTGATGTDRIVATADNVAIGLQSGFGPANGIEEISAGGFANVSIVGGTGNDTLDFSATTLTGIAKIDGGAGTDTITGSAGDDTIVGGAGNDTLRGGDGGDTYQIGVGAGVDNILDTGATGTDRIVATADSVAIGLQSGFGPANGIEEISSGGFANVSIVGGTGNYTLNFSGTTLTGIAKIDGGAGTDTITGSAGDDTIVGGAGNDTLRGGDGSDTYQIGVGAGVDNILDTGATGTDRIVATADNVAIGLQSGFGPANGIEEISAGGFANVSIVGGTGNDTLDFSATTLTGIAKIDGGAGNDTITGSAGADTIVGGAGNDTLKGGDGGDTYQIGVGAGLDTFADTGATGTDKIVATADNVVIGLQSGFGPANGIEEISSGGFANVSIAGGTGNDTLDFSATTLTGITKIDGGTGNDTIIGSAGDDTIVGGAGNDTLKGGDGSDTYQIGAGAGLDTFADTGATGTDKIVATADNVAIGLQSGFGPANGIEEISAGGFANVTLVGGTGNDTLDFSGTTLTGIAKIDGGAGNDTITGSAGADTIVGGAGNDTLKGGDGADTYQIGAGAGFDAYQDTGATGADKIVATADGVAIGLQSGFGAASGIEEISAGGFANVTIQGGTGNDILDFSNTLLTGIAKIDGGAGNDTITGSAGADSIAGGAGNDVLKGGDGGDTYLVGASEGFDAYQDTGATGTDKILATADNVAIGLQSGFGPASGIEEISANGHTGVTIQAGTGNDTLDFSNTILTGITRIDGSAGNDVITGSTGNDTIYGGTGNDTLSGGDGDDVIAGGAGADTLSGGNGSNDTLSYAQSSAGVTIDLANNLASGGDAQGDKISGFENVTGSNFDDVIYGDANNNVIDAGAGNDRVYSSWGIDTIDGGTGSDTIDLTNFNGMGDMTMDLSQGLVYFSGYVAGADHIANFENASGTTGNDTFMGSAGDNTMTGGGGNDTFHFSLGAGHDTIFGGTGTDSIRIDTGGGNGGWLEAVADGSTPALAAGDWLLQLDTGQTYVLHGAGADFDFGGVHAGVLTAADGSDMKFQELEGLHW